MNRALRLDAVTIYDRMPESEPVTNLGVGRELLGRQLKYEIYGEPLSVAFNGLIKNLGGHAIDAGQIGVQHHPLPANRVDALLDPFNPRCGQVRCHRITLRPPGRQDVQSLAQAGLGGF